DGIRDFHVTGVQTCALPILELEARNQVRLSRAELAELIGRPVAERLSRIREDIELKAPAQSIDSWIQRATTANPALKARYAALRSEERRVGKECRSRQPPDG